MKHVKAPDFPTGALDRRAAGDRRRLHDGPGHDEDAGRLRGRGRTEGRSADRRHRAALQVNKARLAEKIAELVERRRSSRASPTFATSLNVKGMRLVIDLKKNAVPHVVLNQLYKRTQLQDNFAVNMLALVDGVPRTLNLGEVDPGVHHAPDHRRDAPDAVPVAQSRRSARTSSRASSSPSTTSTRSSR